MADATKLLIGGPGLLYVMLFAMICVAGIVFVDSARYALVLKWMTLTLFSYIAVLRVTNISWGEALSGMFVPRITWSHALFTTVLAIFGTTISPYLFLWQAS